VSLDMKQNRKGSKLGRAAG